MWPTAYWVSVAIAVCTAASFFFALAETSLFALGKWRVRQLAERVPGRGEAVLRLLEKPSELLATISLGNTMANAGIVAMALWPVWVEQWRFWPVLGVVLALTLLVGEILPKTLAVRDPERWALRVAPGMLFVERASRWFQILIDRFDQWLIEVVLPKSYRPQTGFSDEDYKELLEMAYQQGTLGQGEKDIILQVVTLDRKVAENVMKPRSQIAEISDELTIEEMMAAARQYKHRRLPMYDEKPEDKNSDEAPQQIVGVLNARMLLLNPQADLVDVVELPSFVPASMNLLQLMKSLQRQQRGLAIVVDEFGYTAGLVTMEDILEEVVGPIGGEETAHGFVMEKLSEGRWRVNGTMWLEDFQREYPALGEVPGVDTMGGLMVHLLEVVPNTGDFVLFRGLRLTAQVVDERRVREVLVDVVKKKK